MLFKIFKAKKFGMGFFRVNFWHGDFLGFWFLPPFDHPRHLKSGASPPPCVGGIITHPLITCKLHRKQSGKAPNNCCKSSLKSPEGSG